MKKNAKKLQKNLHISKKSCTFAPSNEKDTNKKPQKNKNYEQELHDKEPRRDNAEHGNN